MRIIGARAESVPVLPPESIGRGVGSLDSDDEGDSETILPGVTIPLFDEDEPGAVQPEFGGVAGVPAGGE